MGGKTDAQKKKELFFVFLSSTLKFWGETVESNVKTHTAQLTVLNVGFCMIDTKQQHCHLRCNFSAFSVTTRAMKCSHFIMSRLRLGAV